MHLKKLCSLYTDLFDFNLTLLHKTSIALVYIVILGLKLKQILSGKQGWLWLIDDLREPWGFYSEMLCVLRLFSSGLLQIIGRGLQYRNIKACGSSMKQDQNLTLKLYRPIWPIWPLFCHTFPYLCVAHRIAGMPFNAGLEINLTHFIICKKMFNPIGYKLSHILCDVLWEDLWKDSIDCK